jgi:RHS repeat-associated protein
VNFAYDQNGNLTADGRRTFAYDDENQLTSVIVTNGSGGSTKSEFVYDGMFRRRVRKEYTWSSGIWNPASEIRYVCDGRLVLQERDANNLPLVTYTRGLDLSGRREEAGGIGGLLARTDNATGQSAFYHADGNGNITALVNAQQLGVARYTYDPFGNTLSKFGPLADANLYRFSSKESHEPSGLVYYLYRFYDPNLQRWINRDPIGENGGVNLYRFVFNASPNLIDVWGFDSEPTLKNLLEEEGCGIDNKFTDPETGRTLTGGGVLKEMCKEVGKEAATSVAAGVVARAGGAVGERVLGKLWCKCKCLFKKAPKGPLKVDPARLRLPPTRAEGADPCKLADQIRKHGTSTEGMPSIEVTRGADGLLRINDGVTRATRAAMTPGTKVPVEVIEDNPALNFRNLPTVKDRLPGSP